MRKSDGTIITFDHPNAGTCSANCGNTRRGQGTRAYGINPAGEITGWFVDAVDVRHGYVRAADGTITEFDVSGATSTSPYAISPDGTVTGWYDDAVGSHGFVRDPSGIITVFDVPGGVSNTFPSGITPLGQIEGNYADTKGVNHGFLGYAGGPFTTLDVPSGAGTGANQGTIPKANNNPGAISGSTLTRTTRITASCVLSKAPLAHWTWRMPVTAPFKARCVPAARAGQA